MVSTIRFLVMYNVEFFPFSDICSYNIGISTWFLDIEIYYKLGRWQSSGSPFSDIYFIPHNLLFYFCYLFRGRIFRNILLIRVEALPVNN